MNLINKSNHRNVCELLQVIENSSDLEAVCGGIHSSSFEQNHSEGLNLIVVSQIKCKATIIVATIQSYLL